MRLVFPDAFVAAGFFGEVKLGSGAGSGYFFFEGEISGRGSGLGTWGWDGGDDDALDALLIACATEDRVIEREAFKERGNYVGGGFRAELDADAFIKGGSFDDGACTLVDPPEDFAQGGALRSDGERTVFIGDDERRCRGKRGRGCRWGSQ